jgi:hypothetical protein
MGGGKAGCRPTKKGYVTVNQGKDGMACIHSPNGSGICWPGGKTGYNKSIQVCPSSGSAPSQPRFTRRRCVASLSVASAAMSLSGAEMFPFCTRWRVVTKVALDLCAQPMV